MAIGYNYKMLRSIERCSIVLPCCQERIAMSLFCLFLYTGGWHLCQLYNTNSKWAQAAQKSCNKRRDPFQRWYRHFCWPASSQTKRKQKEKEDNREESSWAERHWWVFFSAIAYHVAVLDRHWWVFVVFCHSLPSGSIRNCNCNCKTVLN